MGMHHSPRIVRNGLILHLDAGDRNSYPGSGTTVYDLSGRGNNANLQNGAYFNSSKNGHIRLDGTNDRIQVPDSNGDFDIGTGDFTVNLWINQGAWAQYPHLFAFDDQYNFSLKAIRGDAASDPYQLYVYQGYSVMFTNLHLTPGSWQMVTLVRAGTLVELYLDGELVADKTDSSGPKNISNSNIYFGWGAGTEYTYQERGPIHVYNRRLSAAEVKQNYAATSRRFQVVEKAGDWLKVFRHYSGTGEFFSAANDWANAKRSNVDNPQANKYSILDTVQNYYINSRFTFKLVYPTLKLTNIWSQTNNPVEGDGSGGVTGYTAISIDTSASGWGGLERYDAQSDTFLDGTLSPQINWFYAIGSASSYGGSTTFPSHNGSTNLVELWVKYR